MTQAAAIAVKFVDIKVATIVESTYAIAYATASAYGQDPTCHHEKMRTHLSCLLARKLKKYFHTKPFLLWVALGS